MAFHGTPVDNRGRAFIPLFGVRISTGIGTGAPFVPQACSARFCARGPALRQRTQTQRAPNRNRKYEEDRERSSRR